MAIKIRIVSDYDDKGVANATDSLGKLGKAAGVAVAAVSAAVAGIAVKSVQEFAKFDSALVKSQAIMGDLTDAMKKDMSDAAREVAKATTFSAEQAGESFFFLASAGLDAEASIKALPQVAQFAQAGMFDMAQATDLLTDAQSALGLTIRDDAIKNMENMAKVSDVLVRANTLANASVEQFSIALTTKAGASLRALGKDVEEGVAVLAAFADQGIKGEIAGTQLSIVLRDLTTKAINNKDAFDKMGIAVFDNNGEMNNLGNIIGDLENALAGMSDETQKATLLQLGFSDKSLASLQALLGTSEAIKTYEKELRSASGFTGQVATKQLESFESQMQLLQSALADVGIEIGYQLVPVLQDMIPYIVDMAEDFGPKIVDFFKFWADVIKAAMTEGTFLNTALKDLERSFGLLGTAMSGGKSDAQGFSDSLGNLVYVLEFVTTTMASLIAGLQGFGHAWDALMRGDIAEFWRFLTTDTIVYQQSLNEVKTELDNVGQEGVTAYGHLAELDNIGLDNIKRNLIETANAARALFVGTTFTGAGGTQEWLDNMFGTGSAKTKTESKVAGFVGAVTNTTQKTVDSTRQTIQNLINQSQKQLDSAQSTYSNSVKRAKESYADNVLKIEKDFANRLSGIIQQSQDRLRSAYRSAVEENIAALFDRSEDKSVEGLVKSLSDKLSASRQLLANSAELASQGFSQTFIEQVVSAGTETGNELASAILKSTPETQKELQKLFAALEVEASSGMDSLAKEIYDKQGLATQELKNLYDQTGIELKSALFEQQQTLANALEEAATALYDSIVEIRSDFDSEIDKMGNKLGGMLDKINAFKKALGGAEQEALAAAVEAATMPGGSLTTGASASVATAELKKAQGILIDSVEDIGGVYNYLGDRIANAERYLRGNLTEAQRASALSTLGELRSAQTGLYNTVKAGGGEAAVGTVININVKADTSQSLAMVGKSLGNTVAKYVTGGGQVIVSPV